MKVKMTRDYKEYKEGERYDVDEALAKNLFKMQAATVDRMITKGDTVKVKVVSGKDVPRKSRLKKLLGR